MFRPFDLINGYCHFCLWKGGLRSSVIMVKGETCHYWRGGKGAALLLIHGLGGSTAQDFRGMAPRLARYYHVISPDLPGFGASHQTNLRQSVSGQAEFLRDFMEALQLKKVHVLGNSMGGWIALKMAHRYPELFHKMVLTATAGIRFDPPPLEVFTPQTEAEIVQQIAYLFYRPRKLPGWLLRDWLRMSLSRRHAVQEMLESMLTGEDAVDDLVSDIQIPTLILWGKCDRLIPVEVGQRLASLMQNSRLELVPQCGHLLLHENPKEILRHVRAWLK